MAAVVIPLIAAVAPEAAATALTYLGIGASATAAAVGANAAFRYLSSGSTADQFTTATSNYLKAEQDREASRTKGLGGLAQAEANKEIAANYDYLSVDPNTGSIAINADRPLSQGGPLQLQEINGKVTVSNDQVNVEIPYTNYGTVNNPSAVAPGIPVNMATSDDGLFPIVQNRDVLTSDPQLVAQTAIEQAKRSSTTLEDYGPNHSPVTRDVLSPETVAQSQPVVQSQEYLGSIPTSVRNPALDSEIIRESARGGQRGYLEDVGNPSDVGGITRAANLEQARSLDASEAAAQPSPVTPNQSTGALPGFNTTGGSTNGITPTVIKTDQPNTVNTGGVVSKNTEIPAEKPNPLHAYQNYTYNISWYMVPKDVMNQITTGQISPGGEDAILAQSELILRSGGSPSDQKGKYFGVDFFIDNLVMKSIVGISGRNRSTDVVEFDFEVTEPYNVSLLPRMILTANAQTGRPDWAACFYIFKIQFFGYDDDGIPQNIAKTTKYIPHSLVSMTFDVTNKGAHYRFKAIPCHHFAQTLLDNTIPFHMEIGGQSLEELFNGAAKSVASQAPASNGSVASARQQEIQSTNNGGTPAGSNTFTQGVADALNKNEVFITQTRKAKKIPTVYKFRFEDGIGDYKVVDPKSWTQNSFRMGDPKNPNELVGKSIKLDPTKNVFKVQAGTRITDLISSIMQVSEYMSKQYQVPSPTDKPLYSFKIVPEVKFLDYDTKTNYWGKEITYVIIPYTIHGYDHEGFGQLPPPGVTKSYNWIFTGKNTDIIDVRITYEAAFYTIKNATKADESQGDGVDPSGQNVSQGEDLMSGVFPRRVKPVNGIADRNNTGPVTENPKSLAVAELFKRQFDSIPDNVSLNMTIVGDPDLIQQDNIMYGVKTDKNKLIYDFGSLNFMHYEAYFKFKFKVPRNDYDPDTGLFDLTDSHSNTFDGLYKIVGVTNEFRGGKFTQKLDNFRVMKQSKSGGTAADSTRPQSGIKTEAPTGNIPIENNRPTTEENTTVPPTTQPAVTQPNPNPTILVPYQEGQII